MSLSAVVLPAPVGPSNAVTWPARASKEMSSTAGASSLRGLLVNPKTWITRSKIARYVRFFLDRAPTSQVETGPLQSCWPLAAESAAPCPGSCVTLRGAASGG